MSNVEVFERSLHATHVWLNDISEELGPDKQQSYHALKAVLHALRDNLPTDESAHLAAQLPTLVRGIYYAEWNPSSNSTKDRSKKKFVERVEKSLRNAAPMDPEDACQAVFRTLNYHLSPGELKQARAMLVKPIQALWPDPEEEQERDDMRPEQDRSEEQEDSEAQQAQADSEEKASNVHHLSRREQEEIAAEEASAEEQRQRKRKDQTMSRQSDYEDDDAGRGYRGRGYEGGYYDAGRFTQEDPDYRGAERNRDQNESRYYGRSNGNRADYDNRSSRRGRQYGDRAYRQAYPDTSPRDPYYGEESRRDYGEPGGGPSYTEREEYEDYPPRSRRDWNEGRRVVGNRQSYGYEDERRWRDKRWSD